MSGRLTTIVHSRRYALHLPALYSSDFFFFFFFFFFLNWEYHILLDVSRQVKANTKLYQHKCTAHAQRCTMEIALMFSDMRT